MVCPGCGSGLSFKNNEYTCTNTGCNKRYPVYYDIPVMITPDNETFDQKDFDTQVPPDIFFKQYKHPFVRFLQKIRPDVTLNYTSKKNYTGLARRLSGRSNVRILVVGGSIDGNGMAALKSSLPPDAIMVESDVAHGPNTSIIFDSHNIPFKEGSFDLVIAQAVLEHVLDPFTCVAEIHRVLKTGGMVYAETPFMQQVHGGKYDFHRFSLLGHRRLFRHFEEINSGLVAGAGSSLAWSMRYFIMSFAPNKKIDKVLSYVSCFLVFWLKYFDYLLNSTTGSLDAACGVFFIGEKKSGYTLSDKELLSQYKGYRY
jgi:SAM-dependent methyltransferase